MFFGYFTRFINAWKAAETENEQRKKRLEAEAKKAAAKNKEAAEPQSKVKVIYPQRGALKQLKQFYLNIGSLANF